jgi:hypothetical protein
VKILSEKKVPTVHITFEEVHTINHQLSAHYTTVHTTDGGSFPPRKSLCDCYDKLEVYLVVVSRYSLQLFCENSKERRVCWWQFELQNRTSSLEEETKVFEVQQKGKNKVANTSKNAKSNQKPQTIGSR